MPKRLASALTILLLLSSTGHATQRRFVIAPADVQLGFRAYGFGMFPIDGAFTRFNGILTLDDQDPSFCRVELKAEADSLRMQDRSMTADALGPDLLDVERYPAFGFDGACTGNKLQGMLLLHGISRPVSLDVERGQGQWQAQGSIRRADWGMSARPLVAGPTVRITLITGLPAGFR